MVSLRACESGWEISKVHYMVSHHRCSLVGIARKTRKCWEERLVCYIYVCFKWFEGRYKQYRKSLFVIIYLIIQFEIQSCHFSRTHYLSRDRNQTAEPGRFPCQHLTCILLSEPGRWNFCRTNGLFCYFVFFSSVSCILTIFRLYVYVFISERSLFLFQVVSLIRFFVLVASQMLTLGSSALAKAALFGFKLNYRVFYLEFYDGVYCCNITDKFQSILSPEIITIIIYFYVLRVADWFCPPYMNDSLSAWLLVIPRLRSPGARKSNW